MARQLDTVADRLPRRLPLAPRLLSAATAALALAVLAAPAVPPLSSSSCGPPGTVLDVGAAREGSLQAGGAMSFTAGLAAGTAYRIAVDQHDIDLVVEVRDPTGTSLVTVDGPLDHWGAEEILLRPTADGCYRIEVRAEQKGVAAGRFVAILEEIGERSPAERQRARALAAVTAAGSELARHGSDGPEHAFAAFQEARDSFHEAGDQPGEAETTFALAALAHQLGHLKQAAELYRDAAARFASLRSTAREMWALSDLGLTRWQLSDLDAAQTAMDRGLELALGLGDALAEANLRNNQCLVVHARGNLRAALDCYSGPLALFRRLGAARDEAAVLNNLGFADYNLGEPGLAETNYREALAIRRAIGDRAGEAQDLNNLAVLFRSLGEVGRALDHYRAALEILAGLGDRRQEAAALSNLGTAYASLGEEERARIYLQQALELRRQLEDRRGQIATLNSLGWLESRAGAPGRSVPIFQQAITLAEAISDPRGEGVARGLLGEAWSASGRPAEAVAELDRALALLQHAGDRYGEAHTLSRKGVALLAAGRPADAVPIFDHALSLAHAIGDRAGETEMLTARGRARRDSGQLDAARADAQAAVALVESLRTGLSSPDLRASFLGSRGEAYELQVDILMRLDALHPGQGFAGAAFKASEQAHAHALLDVLRESGAEPRRGADPDLAARQRDLERRLSLKVERRQSLLGRVRADQAERPEVKVLESEIESATAELDAVDAELRRRDPRYADLTRPAAANPQEVQELLGPETLLLEYSLGRERSYLWAVDGTSIHAYALPRRAEIERAARAFYEAVSSPPAPGDAGRARLGEGLARLLLAPAAAVLGGRRLAIVADGALHYVPFEALPEAEGVPLLRRHEVVVLPSASVLAAQRRTLAGRAPAPRLAIVFADPVFSADDSRLARPGQTGRAAEEAAASTAASSPRGRPIGELAGELAGEQVPLGRLRFSRQEALAIAALRPPGEVATDLDFAASRDAVLSSRLRDYRFLHFATHGLFDVARPELSGLALSRLDAAGHPRDGFLGLRDIYDLDLAADLVVLSGCRTALGREIRGEGLLGLTRGFLYAGAPRVVASLWWIDDRATATLMARFYRGMWVEGLRPAAALREARLALAAEHRFRDPFFWGAFVLQGDWR